MQSDAGCGDHVADEGGGVLGEHRARGGVRCLPHLLEQPSRPGLSLAAQLASRPEERRQVEEECDAEHDVGHDERPGGDRVEQLADTLVHGQNRADDEDSDRREQRPEVRLAPPAQPARRGGPTAPMLRHEEQHAVARIRGRVHGLREHRRRPGDHGGGEFGRHNAEVRE